LGGGRAATHSLPVSMACLQADAVQPWLPHSCSSCSAAPIATNPHHPTHAPTSSVQAPVKNVATLMVSSEVPSAVAASRPASRQMPAMLVAMAERKMRPTSCTWPTVKQGGRDVAHECKESVGRPHVLHLAHWDRAEGGGGAGESDELTEEKMRHGACACKGG